ncbi:MAG TPA: hypothetical protein EYP10_10765, partial [Armatimonadetes bacterium]|nr:hypothetical protein [Armatimonadota bacterium]
MQPLHRFVCLLAVAVLMTSWSPVCEGMDVRVENGRLLVNGEPFFFLSTSGIVVSLDEMKRHHLNTVFSWSRKLMTDVADDATRLGFMLMPFVQSPGADQDAIRKMVVSFRDNQNLLAWNIGDDLNATHKDAVMQAVALVRKLDPKHRPIAFDAIRDEREMAPYADLFCTYYYPLLKREWSLRAYREFLERHARLREMRVKLKPSQAFWTWVQVHTQFWYTHRVHGGPERAHIASRFPDAEHIRLLTYEALAAGCKGIIYYSHRFLAPDWYGKDRYAEVGILGAELSIVGRLIADSERIHGARALARRVHAQALKGPFGLLIVLIVEGKDYQFQPAEGRIENVRVRVPVIPRGAKAL